jgi:hypothetical protein
MRHAQEGVVTYDFQKCISMPLRKALEDLREVTLAALPGPWSKLLYFAKLRLRSGGNYSHWGFQQRHGKAADRAMREAHTSIYREVLYTPIPELVIGNKGEESTLLETPADAMVPETADSKSHFLYVLATVKALARRQKRS